MVTPSIAASDGVRGWALHEWSGFRGTLLIKKINPDHHRALGIGLLECPRRRFFYERGTPVAEQSTLCAGKQLADGTRGSSAARYFAR